MTRLLRFAGLALEVTVERQPERLDVRLSGADEERLRQIGAGLLDDLGHLLPRLVKSLSGKQVLCRIDGAGIRSAREEELRAVARRAAAEVLRTGQPVLLDPLPAVDRRIVHLTLAEDPRFSTESLGQGVEKSLRIALAGAPGPPSPQE
jgi:spoIIIJ-associated protein